MLLYSATRPGPGTVVLRATGSTLASELVATGRASVLVLPGSDSSLPVLITETSQGKPGTELYGYSRKR